jgi:hypothetical protein
VKALVEGNDASTGGRLLRWRLTLSEFDFDIVHRKGKLNEDVDCLFRLPLDSFAPHGEGPTDVTPTTMLNMLHKARSNNDHSEDESDVCNDFFPPHDIESWTAVTTNMKILPLTF